MYNLSYYIAGKLPILKNTDVLPVLLHCWAVPNLETLLTYTLSYYIAELFLILEHCWVIFCFNTILCFSQT